MRRRYATATAEAEDATASSENDQAPPAGDENRHSEVNGQVTTPTT
jgi:hypothetical protein